MRNVGFTLNKKVSGNTKKRRNWEALAVQALPNLNFRPEYVTQVSSQINSTKFSSLMLFLEIPSLFSYF